MARYSLSQESGRAYSCPCSVWQSMLPLVGTSTLRSNMQPLLSQQCSSFTPCQTRVSFLYVLLRKSSTNTQCQVAGIVIPKSCFGNSGMYAGKLPYTRARGGKQSPEPTHLFHLPALEIVRNHFSNPGTNLPYKKSKVQTQETLTVWDRSSPHIKLKEKDAIHATINF